MFASVFIMTSALALSQSAPGASPADAPKASASPTPSAADLKIPQALFDRILIWWNARAARDHKAMYDLMDPRYRGATPYEAFVAENILRTRFSNLSVRIEKARVVAEGIRVTVTTQTNLERLGIRDMSSEDLWVLSDGRWFKVWEPVELPFPKS